jgi:hypothetical protein
MIHTIHYYNYKIHEVLSYFNALSSYDPLITALIDESDISDIDSEYLINAFEISEIPVQFDSNTITIRRNNFNNAYFSITNSNLDDE